MTTSIHKPTPCTEWLAHTVFVAAVLLIYSGCSPPPSRWCNCRHLTDVMFSSTTLVCLIITSQSHTYTAIIHLFLFPSSSFFQYKPESLNQREGIGMLCVCVIEHKQRENGQKLQHCTKKPEVRCSNRHSPDTHVSRSEEHSSSSMMTYFDTPTIYIQVD